MKWFISVILLNLLSRGDQAVNKTRVVIIVSDDNTWISFNDSPLVEIDDDLHPLSLEDAYSNHTFRYYNDSTTRRQVQPFSFLSPYVDPLCVVRGKAFRAMVYGSFNISCSPPDVLDDYYQQQLAFAETYNNDLEPQKQKIKHLLLQPNHGPRSGGTRVTVSGVIGEPSSSGRTPLCLFGNITSPAIDVIVELGHIVCLSPPGSSAAVKVDISLSGQTDSFSNIGVLFEYDEDVAIQSIFPAAGPVTGGTLVKVRGGPVQSRDEIICRVS
jgi:hypothetical protein